MWDGGVNHLEVQPLAPITNPVEMDETMANVLVKLRRNQTYRSLFLSAFDSDSITTQRVMYAMAQFMGAMVSAGSKYDQYRGGLATLTPSETNGLSLFRTHCESCHKEPLMTDMQFRNNGLNPQFSADPGRAMITGMPQDSGLFRVPSLRNVALTDPYMHDGRFSSLTQVLNHYSSGIVSSSTLDPLFNNGSLQLTVQDKTDIIAFLYTLTDQRYIADRRFSEVQ
jgi:cytochrome c peroxidase